MARDNAEDVAVLQQTKMTTYLNPEEVRMVEALRAKLGVRGAAELLRMGLRALHREQCERPGQEGDKATAAA